MRVVIVTQYFPPETGGPQNRMASLAEGLSRRGHDVTVVTAKPNYPTGVVFDGYEEGFFVDSEYRGIPVVHCWILPDEDKTPARRILYYLSFMFMSVLGALRGQGDVDVVLASSPPLLVGISGWAISRLRSARFVFDVRDLWPDVAVAMGQLPSGWPARLARTVERFIYRRADGITAVTDAFCRDIRERVDNDTPVARIANGTMPAVFRVRASKEELRRRLDLPEGFLVTYAGNVGLAQGLGHIIDAAEVLDREGNGTWILIVGDGPLRRDLERTAAQRGIESLLFRERVPLELAAQYMSASDALLIPLGDRAIYRKFIPSKLFDAMAAGRPILISVDGEAREIVERTRTGLYYPPEDAVGLVESIKQLRDDPGRSEMGRRGRRWATRRFSRDRQAEKMVRFIENQLVHIGGTG